MTRLRPVLVRALVPCLTLGLLIACVDQPNVYIDSPVEGTFHIGTTITVTGRIDSPSFFESVTVNGIPVPIAPTWSVEVPLDTSVGLNRIVVEGTFVADAGKRTASVMIVAGDGVDTGYVMDGATSPGVAMHLADAGLAQIAPVVESLSSGSLDIAALITDQNPVATGSLLGVNYTANAVEAGFGGFGLTADTTPTGLDTSIQIDDFFLEIDMELGFLGSCTIEIQTTSANLGGLYDLGPLAGDPQKVDVVLASPVDVQLAGFTSQYVSGICDDPIIGDIINLIVGQGTIQQLMQDGFESNLADPDGAGPLDSPLAAAIEQALAGISIAGPVGIALEAQFDAPITSIVEETNGLTIFADAAIYTTDPNPPGPDLAASFTVEEPLPLFDPTTPDGDLPYGMAFAISTSAMNQLLKSQIENGLMQQTITQFLGLQITAGLLEAILPGLDGLNLPPNLPMQFAVLPTMAPVVTGNPGPNGELAELYVGSLWVALGAVNGILPLAVIAGDMHLGLDLTFTQAGLSFSITPPNPEDISFYLVTAHPNWVATEEELEATYEQLFPFFAAEITSAIDSFPIPSLLGLELEPVEVSRLGGGYIGLFANLVQTPTASLANAFITDLSSGDFDQQGGCWLREWRHRISGTQLGNTLSTSARGMLGADAGCTTNDASSSATLAHRVSFDVVSVPGEPWTVDIDHSILGSLDRISDGYNDGFLFQDGGGTASVGAVAGTWAVVGGNSGDIGFVPSVTQISDGIGGSSSDQDVEFGGTNGVTIVGSGDVSIDLDFAVALDAFSNSNIAFPTANGDEMAIRLGKNDTIDANFSAGSYPGMGSRNIADDGHRVTVTLDAEP